MKNKSKNIILITALVFVCHSFYSQNINPNGFNTFRYENDSISAEGFLKNGKPNGYWKNYEKNGLIKSEGNRKFFMLDSTWKFYKKGFLKEVVNYEKNKRNGDFLEFIDSGLIYSKSVYKNDTLQGEQKKYYSSGELQFLYFYLNGNYHGKAYELDKDSVVISIFNYNKGKLIRREKINRFDRNNNKTGVWKKYSASGILIEEGAYKNGKKKRNI